MIKVLAKLLAIIFAALLLSHAFPPYDNAILAWVGLMPFLAVLYHTRNLRSKMLYSFLFGVCYFGSVLFWVTSVSVWVGVWGYVAWVALLIYQALFLLLFAYGFQSVQDRLTPGLHFIAVPFLWIFVEWARSIGEFAVPGAFLGYTQYQNLPLIQISQIVGVFGISFLIVMVNSYLALIFQQFDVRKGISRFYDFRFHAIILVLLLGNVYFLGAGILSSPSYGVNKIFRIAVIQPNISQEIKLNPRNTYDTLNVLSSMTGALNGGKVDLVVWPETAVTTLIVSDAQALSYVRNAALSAGSFLLTGAFSLENGKIFNSLYLFSNNGAILGRYDKQRLVPFGEYLPFKTLLFPFLESTGFFAQEQSGNNSVQILDTGKLKVGGLICFESLFPWLAKQRAKKSDILVTVTNDAWFGSSAAAYQHLAAGPFRAIENRKYFIQCANTGISAIIDPYGRIIKQTKLNERGVISAEVMINTSGR